ncbi:SMP-30/gluconolactonase/LRE family protein [Phenylobacterium sp.]|jgi:gluconolactonase|uniref:SMP-30/gluconolactonase/LRE family protein n=1 Tax=Phenylobacterium sp. TaxID=1871053 RepID=UPI002F41AAFE
MVSKPVLIAEGVAFAEGPVWCDDGTLVVTSVAEGALYRIWPETGRREKIADTGGGANSAWPADDGGFLVTQNGGLDFAGLMGAGAAARSAPLPPVRWTTAGLQRVASDGAVSYVLRAMQAPNDLAVAADGTVYFTDPPGNPAVPGLDGKVRALRPDGRLELVADGFAYCNGIALEPDGGVVVVEGNGLMRLHPGGRKEWIVERMSEKHAVDGFCLDAEGRFYMASSYDNGLRIVEGTRIVEFLPLPGEGLSTNCCFGGADGRSLFMTNGLPGTVWMWTDMPVAGLGLTKWKAGKG